MSTHRDQLLSLGHDGDTLTQTFDPSADQWNLTYRSSDRSAVYERWYRSQPDYDTVMAMLKQCRLTEANSSSPTITMSVLRERRYGACDAWMYDLG